MFKIIGADGREYGPVAAEQMRQWIREGRANAQTRVLPEGNTEWLPLGEVPEFASALSGGSFTVSADEPIDPRLAASLAGNLDFSIGSCLSRGWDLVVNNFWLTAGATTAIVVLIWAATFIPVAGSLVLNYVLLGGLNWMYLKLARGQKAELTDAFAGFGPLFVPLMLFSVVGQALVTLGFILCILPGIYLTVVWLLFPTLLIMDKGMDFWPAMELSRKVAHRYFWPLLGLVGLALLLMLGGLVACVVGLFVAVPVSIAAIVYAYEDLFGNLPRASAQPLQLTAPGESSDSKAADMPDTGETNDDKPAT